MYLLMTTVVYAQLTFLFIMYTASLVCGILSKQKLKIYKISLGLLTFTFSLDLPVDISEPHVFVHLLYAGYASNNVCTNVSAF